MHALVHPWNRQERLVAACVQAAEVGARRASFDAKQIKRVFEPNALSSPNVRFAGRRSRLSRDVVFFPRPSDEAPSKSGSANIPTATAIRSGRCSASQKTVPPHSGQKGNVTTRPLS